MENNRNGTVEQGNGTSGSQSQLKMDAGGGKPLSGGDKANAGVAWMIAVPALVFLFVFLMLPLYVSLMMAMRNYAPNLGLLGSPFVGAKHLAMFFSSANFSQLFSNTLFYGALAVLLGGVYVFGASYGVASAKNIWVKCGLLSGLLLPVFLPELLTAAKLLPQEWLQNPALFRLGPVLNDLFCIAPIAVLAGGFLKNKQTPLQKAVFVAGCYTCVRIILLFTPNTSFTMLSYSPAVYETADTFGLYQFRAGLIEANGSMAAAVFVTKTLLQLLPAALGTAGLILLTGRKAQSAPQTKKSGAGMVPAVVLGALGVIFFLWIAARCHGEQSMFEYEEVITGLFNGLVVGIAGGILAVGVALSLGHGLSRGTNWSRVILLCVGTILLLTVGNVVGQYQMFRAMGLANTRTGVVLQYGTFGLFGAYLLLIASGGRDVGSGNTWFRRILAPGVALCGVLFCKIFADAYVSFVLLHDVEKMPIAGVLRMLMVSQSFNMSELEPAAVSYLPVVLIPAVIGLGCIWLGGYLQTRRPR